MTFSSGWVVENFMTPSLHKRSTIDKTSRNVHKTWWHFWWNYNVGKATPRTFSPKSCKLYRRDTRNIEAHTMYIFTISYIRNHYICEGGLWPLAPNWGHTKKIQGEINPIARIGEKFQKKKALYRSSRDSFPLKCTLIIRIN